jgi:hypothetical protein
MGKNKLAWEVSFGDYDNDGNLELLSTDERGWLQLQMRRL